MNHCYHHHHMSCILLISTKWKIKRKFNTNRQSSTNEMMRNEKEKRKTQFIFFCRHPLFFFFPLFENWKICWMVNYSVSWCDFHFDLSIIKSKWNAKKKEENSKKNVKKRNQNPLYCKACTKSHTHTVRTIARTKKGEDNDVNLGVCECVFRNICNILLIYGMRSIEHWLDKKKSI